MTPTGSPRRRSSVEHISGVPRTDSTIVGTPHASVGSEEAAEGPTPARRKGRSRAAHHGCRGAMGLPRGRGRLSRLVSPRSGRPERGGCRGAHAGVRSPPGGRCRGGHGESGGGHGGGYGGVGSVCEACVAGGRFIGSGRDPTDSSPASVDLEARGSSSSMTCGTRNRGDGQAGLRGPHLQ
nr:unnamed protein product [Digitaria exilis]